MLVKRNPVLPNIFDNLLSELAINNSNEPKFNYPAVNIIDLENEFNLSIAAPGMNKKDFIIDLTDELLTISANKTTENDDNKDKYTLKEYGYNTFKRSFNLPKDMVDNDKIKATYKNGELIIKLPKKEMIELKPKQIEVK